MNLPFDGHGAISQLIIKKLKGDISAKEQQQLDAWLQADAGNQAVLDRLLNTQRMTSDVALMNSFNTAQMLDKMTERIGREKKRKRLFFYKITAAAAAVFLVVFTLYNTYNNKTVPVQTAEVKPPTLPDSNRLYLTLADGTKIDLDSINKGVVGQQGSAVITKAGNGTLNYTVNKTGPVSNEPVALNTLEVPRGKRFEMVLPDGSKVWLNAQTTLTYPVNFNAGERLIELNGEAYFEVAHHPQWPFKVKTSNQVVQVLGTHFNVAAYADDNTTTTTLVEGKVRVHKGSDFVDIKPGQMSVNDRSTAGVVVQQADLTAALAWRKGLFYFNDERIEDIMKKIARVYDVEVQFKGDTKDKKFWATYPMNKGVENFLKNLEQTNTIHFELQQKKIIVTP